MSHEYEIKMYSDDNGAEPFTEWFWNLATVDRKRVLARIARLQAGNFGDCKNLQGGVSELRLFFGSGYRMYYGKDGHEIIIILCGGDKDSQSKDIQKAKNYWRKYNEKNKKSK